MRVRRTRRWFWGSSTLWMTVLLVGSRPAESQEVARWLPDILPFEPLLAAPRETQFRGSFVLADRPDRLDYADRSVEAEVVIGHSLAVLRMDSGTTLDRAVTLGFELGIFSRFYMESPQKDLISVDYRVGLPLSIRSDAWQVRITVRHVSGHIGDDFLVGFPGRVVRVDDEILQRTKDGVEGLVARSLGPDVRVYTGGDFNFHVNPRVSRAVVRSGMEWNPRGQSEENRAWPFAAINYEYPSFSKRSRTTVVAGMGAMVSGRIMRIEARAQVGASPMGQLGEAEETLFGIGIGMTP